MALNKPLGTVVNDEQFANVPLNIYAAPTVNPPNKVPGIEASDEASLNVFRNIRAPPVKPVNNPVGIDVMPVPRKVWKNCGYCQAVRLVCGNSVANEPSIATILFWVPPVSL